MNSTKDPIWDWDTETSSVNETDQSWSNISLDSEDDRPLGGTLQFQSEDSKLMVHDDNIEKYTTENVPLNEFDRDSGDQNIDSSLAYKFGMLVVSGAAQVVSNVTDGGKQRDTIKKLQVELDDSLEAQDKWKEQLRQTKQRVAECEQSNNSLEQRLEEQAKEFGEEVTELAKGHKNFIKESQEKSEKLICELKSKVDESHKKINGLLEKNDSLAKENDKLSYEISHQPTTSKTEQQNHCASPRSAEFLATIEHKNKQLDDATRALAITHTRCDQLRHQLMMSMNSMRTQTDQMKLSTRTLNSAMTESNDLKEKIKVVEAKSRDLEEKLKEETKLKMAAIEDLRSKEEALNHLTNEIKLLHTQHDSDISCLQKIQIEFNAKERDLVEKTADNKVQLAIEAAKYEQREILHQQEVEKLIAEIHTNSEHLSSKEVECNRFAEELNSARLQLSKFQENLVESMSQTNKIEDSYENKIKEFELKIESLQVDKDKIKDSCEVLQIKLDESLQSRKDELARANVKFRNLTRENSTLKSTQQRVKVSSLSQTNNARERALEDELEDVKKERAELLRRLKILGVVPDEIDTAPEALALETSRLERVIEHDRWTMHYQGNEIGRLRHELHRLEWLHRQDRSTLSRLSQENEAYQKYLYHNRRPSTYNKIETREHGDYLNAIPEETPIDEIRQQSTPIKTGNHSPHSADSQLKNTRGNTSPEIETALGRGVDQQPCSSNTVEGEISISPSFDKDKNARKSHSKKKKRSMKKEKGHSLEKEIKNSLRKLPIWRQENPDNHNFDQTFLDRLVAEKQAQLDAESSEILQNERHFHNTRHSSNCLRHKSLNSSKDDGYASSNNSEQNRRHRHASSATNESVFLPDTVHYVINGNDVTHPQVLLVDDNDTTNVTEVDSIMGNNDDHYYVTFNSVTFDIATFDLQGMRQVTSTFTSEEMPQFCEFMAGVAQDINADPAWRGRHKLGLPCDWMDLKSSFY